MWHTTRITTETPPELTTHQIDVRDVQEPRRVGIHERRVQILLLLPLVVVPTPAVDPPPPAERALPSCAVAAVAVPRGRVHHGEQRVEEALFWGGGGC